MNFYKRHIGDYIKDASHLSLLEHGVYSRLMDVYYARESGIPDGQAARLVGARTPEEIEAVKAVLSEFFRLVDGAWTQKRCEAEIAAANAQAEANRINGLKGGRPKRNDTEEKPNGFPTGSDSDSEENLSQTPDSINHVIPPNPPSAHADVGQASKPKKERKARISLKTFVENCAKAGEKPISEYRPLLEYVEGSGLPMEFVQLCWHVFKTEFLPEGKNEGRLQADWRKHFLNYVEKGYYRLWYAKPDGTYELTTQGIQALKFHQHRDAA